MYQVREVKVSELPRGYIGANPRLYSCDVIYAVELEDREATSLDVLFLTKEKAQEEADKRNAYQPENTSYTWSEDDRPQNSRMVDNRHRNWRRRRR